MEPHSADPPRLNPIMIFAWNEILPAAIERLPPIQRELVQYVMLQPGKQRPSYRYVNEHWGLAKQEFDVALAAAYGAMRRYLGQYGLGGAGDLRLREAESTSVDVEQLRREI